MKYVVIFVLCFVALAAANPQLLTWPGIVAPLGSRTIVAGPTVVNDGLWGGRVLTPGVIAAGLV